MSAGAADPPLRPRAVARLHVSVCDPAGRPVRVPGLASWLAGVAPARARGTLTLVLASDRQMRALNRRWREVDAATDVLSFPAEDAAAQPRGTLFRGRVPPHLGDVVIARGVAARQAREAGHGIATELRVLALHGLLHLLGHDHEGDTGQMARLERRLRRAGGLRAGLIERAPVGPSRRPRGARATRGARR